VKSANEREKRVRVGLGSDHAGFRYKQRIRQQMEARNLQVKDFGPYTEEPIDYPDVAAPLAEAVSTGEVERAVWVCGTGNGGAMVANRFAGVRATVCNDLLTARYARAHNDSNFLAIGQRIVGEEVALEIVQVWLETPYGDEVRHARRLAKLAALEKQRQPSGSD